MLKALVTATVAHSILHCRTYFRGADDLGVHFWILATFNQGVEPALHAQAEDPADERAPDARAQTTRLANKYAGTVYHALARYGVPQEERVDAAQEVFLTVYQCLEKGVQLRDDPGPWLWDIARRIASNMRQKASHEPEKAESIEAEALADRATWSEPKAALRDLLYRLFDELDDTSRGVVIGVELEQRSLEEVAALHGLSVSAAKKRHTVAIEKLKATLERWQARDRARGIAVLPFPLAMLFAADRVPLPVPDSFRHALDAGLARRLDGPEGGTSMDGDGPGEPPTVKGPPSPPRVPPPPPNAIPLFGTLFCGMVIGGLIVFLLLRPRSPVESYPLPGAPQALPLVAMDLPVRVASAPGVVLSVAAPVPGSAASVRALLPEHRPERSAAGRGTDLEEEAKLLQRAAANEARGNAVLALEALLQHWNQFPRGQYARLRNAALSRLCAMPALQDEPACAHNRK